MDVLVVGGIFREVFDTDAKPSMRYGGSGLTASVAAARFGVETALASYVGTDDEGEVCTILGEAGVDSRAVIPVEGMCGVFAYPTGQGLRQPTPMYRPAEAVPAVIPTLPESKVVLAFGIPDFDPLAEGWLDGLASQTTVIWDRQGWLSRARDASRVLRLGASKRIYLANRDEAAVDAGTSSFEKVMDAQPPDGFGVAVIKLGETGVVVAERSTEEVILTAVPANPVNTNCTVGTGDVFAGTLAARLALGDSVVAAARWGCIAVAAALESGQNLLSAEAYLQVLRAIRHRSSRPRPAPSVETGQRSDKQCHSPGREPRRHRYSDSHEREQS